MADNNTAAVLGAGAWGATLADLLARKGLAVHLWDRNGDALNRLADEGAPFGVPELRLDNSVHLCHGLGEALAGASLVFVVVPSQAVAGLAARIAEALDGPEPTVVLASKGLDLASGRLLTDAAADHLPAESLAVVSGPCIAREVARGIPTSVVAAARDMDRARRVRDAVATPALRVYTQDDVEGVEVAAALKNAVAIAAGVGDGMGFGANSKSALMARGLAEMARFVEALGGRRETTYGLAGMGDLAVTCFSPHSRNRSFGELLGKGTAPDAARDGIGMVVEGEPTAQAALALAGRHGIDAPIVEAVVRLCAGEWTARDALDALMRREMKDEFGQRDRG